MAFTGENIIDNKKLKYPQTTEHKRGKRNNTIFVELLTLIKLT